MPANAACAPLVAVRPAASSAGPAGEPAEQLQKQQQQQWLLLVDGAVPAVATAIQVRCAALLNMRSSSSGSAALLGFIRFDTRQAASPAPSHCPAVCRFGYSCAICVICLQATTDEHFKFHAYSTLYVCLDRVRQQQQQHKQQQQTPPGAAASEPLQQGSGGQAAGGQWEGAEGGTLWQRGGEDDLEGPGPPAVLPLLDREQQKTVMQLLWQGFEVSWQLPARIAAGTGQGCCAAPGPSGWFQRMP